MNGARTDRNLLFGILAVQLDFITPDALVQAMHAWVLAKQRPLGDILVEHAALAETRRHLLETLVEEHVRQHNGDVGRSLATLPNLTPVQVALQQVSDADVQHSLASLSQQRSADDPFATRSLGPRTPAEAGARFQHLRLHAKGGLGEVHVAFDRELKRQVALKEIQNQHADDPRSRERFVLEAEITGGLEHPGIVPVYGMGHHPDGRPFYAMRFIKGVSLREAIHDFHQKNQGRHGLEGVEFRKLLARFLAVCDAVAYAHSRGVLHRDLKPANVMLGPYGETLVVDWGLAKSGVSEPARGASKESTEAPLQPSRSEQGSATLTLPGSLLGTPAYMSPEQAEGRIDLLGPETDVYSLGATLYCLLTGKPPFAEEAHEEVLRKVQRGQFLPPRQANARVPPALEAICLKAMALRPADRYPAVRSFAEDIEHWLADEPVRAHGEPAIARARRWARRHKPLVAGLVALVGTALLLSGVGLGWLQRERAETARAAAKDLEDAEYALSDQQHDEAMQALRRAEGRLDRGGPAALTERLVRLSAELALVSQLDAARLRRATYRDGQPDYRGSEGAYSEAFAQHGLDVAALGPETMAQRIRASAIATQIIAALDDWAFVREQLRSGDAEPLWKTADSADEDAWRRDLRNPAVRRDRKRLEAMAEQASMRDQKAPNLVRLSHALRGAGAAANAELLLRAACQRHPADFWLNFDLGQLLLNKKPTGDPAAALGFLRAAQALRPESAPVANNLGIALHKLEQWPEAIATFRAAIASVPHAPGLHYNLGNVWLDQKNYPEAEKAYREAVRFGPSYAEAHLKLGQALLYQDQYEEALQVLNRGRELGKSRKQFLSLADSWIDRCKKWACMAVLLSKVLAGEQKPDPNSLAELAFFCVDRNQLPATAAHFYERSFAAKPELATAPNPPRRFIAACAAAQAGCGEGEDAKQVDVKERARLREQSRAWLHADLEAWDRRLAKKLVKRDDVRKNLQFWRQHGDLAGVRDADGLARLSRTERQQWQKLWQDVEELRLLAAGTN